MSEQQVPCVYFERPGPDNTGRTLEIAKRRLDELGLRHVLVASTTGATGARAAQLFVGANLVVVSHSTGFAVANEQQMLADHRAAIEAAGGRVLTTQHAFGGLGRAVRRKLGTYQLDEVVAFVLRTFGDGVKVACEITVMAADAGLVPVGEELLVVTGTGRGADTAAVILGANAQDFFDLRVLELLCKPRLAS